MNLHIIDDKQAENDFGYKKIENYQIFVKKSVYRKMMIQEYKSLRNWLWFIYSLIMVISELILNSVILGFLFSLIVTLLEGDFGSLGVESLANIFGKEVRDSITILDLYELIFIYKLKLKFFIILAFIFQLLLMVVNVKNGVKVNNNAFSRQVFYKLHYQAAELEGNKNG